WIGWLRRLQLQSGAGWIDAGPRQQSTYYRGERAGWDLRFRLRQPDLAAARWAVEREADHAHPALERGLYRLGSARLVATGPLYRLRAGARSRADAWRAAEQLRAGLLCGYDHVSRRWAVLRGV